MRFPLFVDAVSRRAGLPTAQAATIARAVLQTMVERVSGDPAGDPPDDLDGYLAGSGPAADPSAPLDPADFVRRVGERAGLDEDTARAGIGAVFATLRGAVTVDEFRDMVARLPRDFDGTTQPIPRPDDA
ncbi:DUF2267 domain-containing protein [Micromonospora sp. KLBMP9576]|uniref:DUF2267 domain-containing protein n=1 Tax=Micromonospora sp. KLBMP9576 TaxID=3424769 RepID=UPI003D8CA081